MALAPEIELAIARQHGVRDSRDGKPFYCTNCGMGWSEFGSCEDVACNLETEDAAKLRFQPSAPIPQITGYNVGNYSDIAEEAL